MTKKKCCKKIEKKGKCCKSCPLFEKFQKKKSQKEKNK
jgi:hypothetical protein